jgi:lipoyl(octanoyl) transferase
MIQYLYLGRVNYDEGLRIQSEVAALLAGGRAHNVLLLLEHPAVLTLGRNAKQANILASAELLERRGIAVHATNRGGDVTYHGPGQLVGYPIFDLHSLRNANGKRMGPVDLVRQLEEALIRLCGSFGVRAERIAGLTGVWCPVDDGVPAPACCEAAPEAKIAAIGIHVARSITSHGFAFNVTTNLDDFSLIVPCGIADHPVTSLERQIDMQTQRRQGAHAAELPSLKAIAHRTALQFGQVFDEQVLAIESLAALRAQSEAASRPEFPAQDTPLQAPAEVERLLSGNERPIRS